MPELFTVLPPHAALQKLFTHLTPAVPTETIETPLALNRVLAEAPIARSPLPAFPRSTMDGYAVRASDTFGASEAIPAYLTVIGESPMGGAPTRSVERGETLIIHTGGMLPDGADAVVMIERTQKTTEHEIEVMRAVAPGENVLQVGEDVQPGDPLLLDRAFIAPAGSGRLDGAGPHASHRGATSTRRHSGDRRRSDRSARRTAARPGARCEHLLHRRHRGTRGRRGSIGRHHPR